jgi:hypothetical protein
VFHPGLLERVRQGAALIRAPRGFVLEISGQRSLTVSEAPVGAYNERGRLVKSYRSRRSKFSPRTWEKLAGRDRGKNRPASKRAVRLGEGSLTNAAKRTLAKFLTADGAFCGRY